MLREHRSGENSAQLVYSSKLLAQTFSQFGSNSYEMCFPEEWLDANPHIIAAAIRGLFKGDGSFTSGQVRLATKSVSLAYRTKDFLKMLGVACSVHTENNGAMRVLIQDENAFYQKIMGYECDGDPATRKPLRLTPEGSWTTFRTSQTESYHGRVYNLEVEEDHSYTVEGLAIHNCWKVGESFTKQQNHKDDVYGKIYLARKAIEIAHNEAGAFKNQAEESLTVKKFGKDTQAFKHYSEGKLPPARIQLRSQRVAVKIFLSHWHAVAFFLANGRLGPQPYSIEHLKHAHVYPIPNPEIVPGLVDALKKAGRTA